MATQVTLNSGSVDSAGSLALKTNGTTTAVTINSSQGVEFNAGTAALPSITTTGDTNTGIFFPAADTIAFSEGGVEAMRIDSSGNVGIGETSPSTYNKLTVNDNFGLVNSNSAKKISFWSTANGASENAKISVDNNGATTNTGVMSFWTKDGTTLSERMRIDSSGNLLVGTTTANPGSGNTATGNYLGVIGVASFSRANDSALTINTNTDSPICRIYRSGSQVGSIDVTTILTTYNTTSDYRLKTVTGAVTGQGARIDALEPVDYLWTKGGQLARGFLAHEFQAVYSNSVNGTKDAVDADGNPVYQSMQASTAEVIADLVAEIQSLRKRLAAAGI